MADVLGKSKVSPPPPPPPPPLQQRSTTAAVVRCPTVVNGDRMAPTPTKRLLINHGKPNFTIPRTTTMKKQHGTIDGNNNVDHRENGHATRDLERERERIRKMSTEGQQREGKTVSFACASATTTTTTTAGQRHLDENEASRIVLRRTRSASSPDGDTKDVTPLPEFIRRQREIQERLAKDNVLDFEKRRSGYFTHVLISPTTPSNNFFGGPGPLRAETLTRPKKIVVAPETDTTPASNGHANNPQPQDESTSLALEIRDETRDALTRHDKIKNTNEEPELDTKNIYISADQEHKHDDNNNNNNNVEAQLEIHDLAKLKFEIHDDGDEDVQLTPVLRRE